MSSPPYMHNPPRPEYPTPPLSFFSYQEQEPDSTHYRSPTVTIGSIDDFGPIAEMSLSNVHIVLSVILFFLYTTNTCQFIRALYVHLQYLIAL